MRLSQSVTLIIHNLFHPRCQHRCPPYRKVLWQNARTEREHRGKLLERRWRGNWELQVSVPWPTYLVSVWRKEGNVDQPYQHHTKEFENKLAQRCNICSYFRFEVVEVVEILKTTWLLTQLRRCFTLARLDAQITLMLSLHTSGAFSLMSDKMLQKRQVEIVSSCPFVINANLSY